MALPCPCTAELGHLVEFTSVTTLTAGAIVEFSERAINIAKVAVSCPGGCARTRRYGQALLYNLGRVLEFLGALWQTTSFEGIHEAAAISAFTNTSTTRGTRERSITHQVSATRPDQATLGRLTLDNVETDLLLQETVRCSTSAINDIALEASAQGDEAGSEFDDQDCKDAWQDLVDCTYAVLASCRANGRS